MTNIQTANLFGFIAAGIGMVMFLPQAISIYKTRNTKSISLLTFVLIFIGSVCWLVYSIILSAYPVILINSAVLVLSLYIILMKLKYK